MHPGCRHAWLQVDKGALYIPAGVYRISQVLDTRKSIVLRGAGKNLTTIYIPVSLTDVYGNTWSEVSGSFTSHTAVGWCDAVRETAVVPDSGYPKLHTVCVTVTAVACWHCQPLFRKLKTGLRQWQWELVHMHNSHTAIVLTAIVLSMFEKGRSEAALVTPVIISAL